jgi:hypothetical protein
MNIKKIADIVKLPIPDKLKEKYVIAVISEDKNVIPIILEILNSEREIKEELLLDTNTELSRALVVLKDDNLKWNKKIIADPIWVVGEIIKHYQKWKEHIKCGFKIKELDEDNNNGTDNSSNM